MVFLRSSLSASIAILSLALSAYAASFAKKLSCLSVPARDVLKRATPTAPHFVAYSDMYVSTEPSVADIHGFNVFALSFLIATGPVDQAQEWQQLTADERKTVLDEYRAAGISLIVSLFGSTETPTTSNLNPITTADIMAAWVLQYGLLGVDVDYEDEPAFNSGTGSAERWLVDFTRQLRKQLPQGQYILTHAPVAPWFSPHTWGGGGYLWINAMVGHMIDWYNVQFYNQGTTEYSTCDSLLHNSSSYFPHSALFQISASGISVDKLVIGKPATMSDADNGYMDTTLLASCIAEANAIGYNGGVMVWEYPHAASEWIAAVRGNTWPVPALSNTATPTTNSTATKATPTSASTTTSASTAAETASTGPVPAGTGDCTSVATWQNNIAYVSGNRVLFNGNIWTARYWNEDSVPGGPVGAWMNDGACTVGTLPML